METIDYERVIADLEQRRANYNAAIDAAILAIKSILAAQTHPLPGGSTSAAQHRATSLKDLSPDAFFGLGLAEAAIRYLSIVKKQQTTREIADALEAAKYHHTSRNFVNTVNTALYRRERDEGDVVRIGRNWALSEWYPGRRRKVVTETLGPKDALNGEHSEGD